MMGFLFAVAVAGHVVWAIGITWILAKVIRAHEAMDDDLSAVEDHLEDLADRQGVMLDLLTHFDHPARAAAARRRLREADERVRHDA